MFTQSFVNNLENLAQAAEIRILLSLFRKAKAADGFAPITCLDGGAFKEFSRNLVVAEKTAENDFMHLFCGADVGFMTGLMVVGKPTSACGAAAGEFFKESYQQAIRDKTPVLTYHHAIHTPRVHLWERLVLPMRELDGRIVLISYCRARDFNSDLLKSVMDTSRDGIIALRSLRDARNVLKDATILAINERALQYLDLEGRALMGKRVLQAIPNFAENGVWTHQKEVIESASGQTFELKTEKQGKATWLRLSSSPFADGVLVNISDITSVKSLREELKSLRMGAALAAPASTEKDEKPAPKIIRATPRKPIIVPQEPIMSAPTTNTRLVSTGPIETKPLILPTKLKAAVKPVAAPAKAANPAAAPATKMVSTGPIETKPLVLPTKLEAVAKPAAAPAKAASPAAAPAVKMVSTGPIETKPLVLPTKLKAVAKPAAAPAKAASPAAAPAPKVVSTGPIETKRLAIPAKLTVAAKPAAAPSQGASTTEIRNNFIARAENALKQHTSIAKENSMILLSINNYQMIGDAIGEEELNLTMSEMNQCIKGLMHPNHHVLSRLTENTMAVFMVGADKTMAVDFTRDLQKTLTAKLSSPYAGMVREGLKISLNVSPRTVNVSEALANTEAAAVAATKKDVSKAA